MLWVFYPYIRHEAGLKSLKEGLNRRRKNETSRDDLIKMAEFVLKISTLTLIEVFTNKCWVQRLLLIMLVF